MPGDGADTPPVTEPIAGGDSSTGAVEMVELALTSMAHGGAAFGRDTGGRVVFVSGGLPGETVSGRVTESGPRYAKAELESIASLPSTDRIAEPPCPYFGRWPDRGSRLDRACGGCQWQHIRYAAQLHHKREVVADALRRLGGIADPEVRPSIGMDDPWRYRNRLTLRMGPSGLGLIARDDTSPVPIDACAITHPGVMSLAAVVGEDLPIGMEVVLRAGIATGDQLVLLRDPLGDLDEVTVDAPISVVLAGPDGTELVAGQPHLLERILGRTFLIPAGSFFQVNTVMAERLVSLVRAAVPPGTGLLVDAFSGVGTFAILLADLASEVVALESDPSAVAAAVDNAAGIDHMTILEGEAAEGLAFLDRRPDVLVIDPPRVGLSRAFMRVVARLRPSTIMYVSCEPSTLARDARQLVREGWRLEWSQPVDMFPQTYHVETVNAFCR